MKYIANTNQMTDTYGLVPVGQVIPDGALSDASIKVLLESGLISEVNEEQAAAIKPTQDG